MASKEPTPGPWEWVGNSLDGPKGETVLEVRDLPERAYPEMQSGALVMDNEAGDKPLLAAARDMYEALEWLTNLARGVSKSGGAVEQSEWDEAWESAKISLARARGEE